MTVKYDQTGIKKIAKKNKKIQKPLMNAQICPQRKQTQIMNSP